MGLGNGNPTSGDKGSNWRYEYQVLKALNQINTTLGGGAGADLATEATLLTRATQTTALAIQAAVESIDGGTPATLGQKLMAASMPVVIASDQSAVPISGSVGGFTTMTSSIVVMSVAGAYATGDYMGTTTTPQSFPSAVRTAGGTGVIKSVLISDKIVTANVAMELWILSATFVAPTDNAAWDLSDANMLNVQAVIPIATTGWYASSAGQVYVDGTISIPFKVATGTSLFYALVARGATPAFTSSDLQVTLGILQD